MLHAQLNIIAEKITILREADWLTSDSPRTQYGNEGGTISCAFVQICLLSAPAATESKNSATWNVSWQK